MSEWVPHNAQTGPERLGDAWVVNGREIVHIDPSRPTQEEYGWTDDWDSVLWSCLILAAAALLIVVLAKMLQ